MSAFLDFSVLRRPQSPNSYLAADPQHCGAEVDETPIIEASAKEVFARIAAYAEGRRYWRIAARDDAALRLAIVITTPWLRFRDDMDIAVFPLERGCAPAIYSRSRVGYSDLGANRRRVKRLLAIL